MPQPPDNELEFDSLLKTIPQETTVTNTEIAAQEEQDLEKEAQTKRHWRDETMRDVIHQMYRVGARFGFVLLLIMIVLRAWHIFAPSNLLWMTADQTAVIDNVLKFIAGGVIGRMAGAYFNRVQP